MSTIKIFHAYFTEKLHFSYAYQSMMKRLAKEESIFAGMSSGGAVTAATKLAQTLDSGLIVCIICDRGDRYLSTGVFG